MTSAAQAGSIDDRSAGLGPHATHGTINRLGQAIDFTFDKSAKTRLQMTIQAIDLFVTGALPTGVVVIHDMAGITKTRLAGNMDGKPHEQHQYYQ